MRSQPRTVEVGASFMPVVVDVPLGEAVEELVERDPALEAGEVGAEAEVEPEAEGEVLDVVAVDVEDVGVCRSGGGRGWPTPSAGGSALPAGMVTPWYSTSCIT